MSKKNTSSAARPAAAALDQQQAEEKRRGLSVTSAVVLVLLVVVVAGVLFEKSRDTSSDVDAPAAGSFAVAELGLAYGPVDARRSVVIYEDFSCSHCAVLEQATRRDLNRLAENGEVRVEHRPINLLAGAGDYSARAANAFRVVSTNYDLEIAQQFHAVLFDNQPTGGEGLPDDEQLIAWAVEAGAEEDVVRPGIEDQSEMDWVEAATKSATDSGVRSTPTILVNGEVVEAGSLYETLAARTP